MEYSLVAPSVSLVCRAVSTRWPISASCTETLLKIRPEVSSGSVSGGIPSKKTTEVSTHMVAENGQTVLIAGLIKNGNNVRRTGVPLLSDLPGALGKAFSNNEENLTSSETIILITPRIVGSAAYDAEGRGAHTRVGDRRVAARRSA
ncbi:MAG: uncharacterized protein JWP34_2116 [Massilia sp.]|nr:uncharacterized protein [Massilia sp.]